MFAALTLDPNAVDYCEPLSEYPDADFLESLPLEKAGQEQQQPIGGASGELKIEVYMKKFFKTLNFQSTPQLLKGIGKKSLSSMTACTSTPYDSKPFTNIENYILVQNITANGMVCF